MKNTTVNWNQWICNYNVLLLPWPTKMGNVQWVQTKTKQKNLRRKWKTWECLWFRLGDPAPWASLSSWLWCGWVQSKRLPGLEPSSDRWRASGTGHQVACRAGHCRDAWSGRMDVDFRILPVPGSGWKLLLVLESQMVSGPHRSVWLAWLSCSRCLQPHAVSIQTGCSAGIGHSVLVLWRLSKLALCCSFSCRSTFLNLSTCGRLVIWREWIVGIVILSFLSISNSAVQSLL